MIKRHVSKRESDHVILIFKTSLGVLGTGCERSFRPPNFTSVLHSCPTAVLVFQKGNTAEDLFFGSRNMDLGKENTAQMFIHSFTHSYIHSFLLECLLYARHCFDTQEIRHKIPAFKVPMI